MVPREVFWPKRDEVTGTGEDYIMRSSVICTFKQKYSADQMMKNELGGGHVALRGESSLRGFGCQT